MAKKNTTKANKKRYELTSDFLGDVFAGKTVHTDTLTLKVHFKEVLIDKEGRETILDMNSDEDIETFPVNENDLYRHLSSGTYQVELLERDSSKCLTSVRFERYYTPTEDLVLMQQFVADEIGELREKLSSICAELEKLEHAVGHEVFSMLYDMIRNVRVNEHYSHASKRYNKDGKVIWSKEEGYKGE